MKQEYHCLQEVVNHSRTLGGGTATVVVASVRIGEIRVTEENIFTIST
jgi:hypothetical protein